MGDTLKIFGITYNGVENIVIKDPSGTEHTYGPSSVHNQTKTASASQSQQVIRPDSGYTGLSSVTINPATLQDKNVTVNGTVTADSGYYGLGSVSVSVPTGSTINNQDKIVNPTQNTQYITADSGYNYTGLGTVTVTGATLQNKTVTSNGSVSADNGYYGLGTVTVNVSGGGGGGGTIESLTVTPTTSQQVFNSSSVDGYKPVTVNAISLGTAGTPSASVGTVTNHSVSITPTVTNSTGYITGGTKTGTAVTVSASDLVSGSCTITSNGTVNVVDLATVTVNVPTGGGGSTATTDTKTTTPASASATIQFTGLLGEPTTFVVIANDTLATGASPFKTAAVVFDGTSLHGQTITNTNNAQVTYDGTNFSKTYSNGTLTITGSTYWQPIQYKLIYTYGEGTAYTANVQVGSGATSITFTGVSEEPSYWSCIFKSNFSTSSGYQRVIAVMDNDSSISGLEMDSSAKFATHWTSTYNNGSLTITSNGTNQGGYFHQPGNYQLTYVLGGGGGGGGEINNQDKTVNPSTNTQIITADEGYTGLGAVTVNAMPSGTAGTPTATKSSVSNYSLTVTPSVTNTTGYITGSTKTGTAVTVAASELVSGTLNITSSGTKDVTNYASASVSALTLPSSLSTTPSGTKKADINQHTEMVRYLNIPAGYNNTAQYYELPILPVGTKTITANGTYNSYDLDDFIGYSSVTVNVPSSSPSLQSKTVTPTTSQQVVTADSNYDALSQVTVNAIPSTYVQPTSTVGSTTYRASTSNQTISSGTYHSAAATIAAVSQTNLSAENIKSGTTISISNGQSNLWSVTGTYEGSSSTVQYDTKTVTASNYPVSLQFTGMKGQPKFFSLRLNASVSSSGSTTYYYIVNMTSNGTTTHGNAFRIGSTRQVTNVTSGYSWSYSDTTLTLTSSAASRSASPGAFYSGSYELMYAY